ncbi:MAG: hypothetical protein J0I47_00230 [Sphingomonas sp.]|uniref:hypothetical protein n=1 Tax=Sphingomonas sp. TaxID=28214 RepID=UPI001ACC53FF|nr:hypothetical protein [Sphingomonas sp.]MBN8806655.1 hypothetical protein [Sphingomonas sp.]
MLNRNDTALRFVERMQVPTGRHASLGKPDEYSNEPRRLIQAANDAMAKAVDVVVRVAKDEGRTVAARNHRAMQEADALGATLAKSRDGLRTEADKVEAAARAMIADKFTLDPSRSFFHNLKHAWVAEKYRDPANGKVAIDKAIKQDFELAAVIHSNEGYLLGMSDEVRLNFASHGLLAHIPEADAELGRADALRTVADRYDGVIKDAHSSFYLRGAAMAYERTHVE